MIKYSAMRVLDIQGRRYGHLEALYRVESHRTYGGNKVTYWRVRCDCGSEKDIGLANLLCGRVKTCAGSTCPYRAILVRELRGVLRGRKRGWSPDAGFRHAAGFYRLKAKHKGHAFLLSDPTLKELFESPCFYCGTAPSNTARRDSSYGVYLYSGIDRIDSKRGYELGNVRSCCWVCNRMKHVLTDAEFMAHIKQIIRWRSIRKKLT